jgi:hypothetical protein
MPRTGILVPRFQTSSQLLANLTESSEGSLTRSTGGKSASARTSESDSEVTGGTAGATRTEACGPGSWRLLGSAEPGLRVSGPVASISSRVRARASRLRTPKLGSDLLTRLGNRATCSVRHAGPAWARRRRA